LKEIKIKKRFCNVMQSSKSP